PGISAQSGITTLSGKKCLDLWGQIHHLLYPALLPLDHARLAKEALIPLSINMVFAQTPSLCEGVFIQINSAQSPKLWEI
ncbi:hypothetical protein ACLH0B_21930, partial [Aeromonas salmonicida]|uniref:hypothetical protein n=1 Tax=Aeromonas salmonicida TaxID=645 RepID=UPI003D06AC02